MFGDEKNLKDIEEDFVKNKTSIPAPYEAEGFRSGSYTKTNKLVTALYMVTDIMDKEEPLRNKLRTLGVNIISDTYVIQQNHTGYIVSANALSKISEIMSFLDVAESVNLISEMNTNILRKEFFELKQAIEESIQVPQPVASSRSGRPSSYSEVNLSELFNNDSSSPDVRTTPTRIGVQKGSTLLKALKKVKMPARSVGGSDKKTMSNKRTRQSNANFEVLKGQRRDTILAIIKTGSNGATITDIKTKATGQLASCSEKTLQRELAGMLKDGVLKKTGEKRWSRYFIS